jgi:hypothetical protein
MVKLLQSPEYKDKCFKSPEFAIIYDNMTKRLMAENNANLLNLSDIECVQIHKKIMGKLQQPSRDFYIYGALLPHIYENMIVEMHTENKNQKDRNDKIFSAFIFILILLLLVGLPLSEGVMYKYDDY